MAKLIKAVEDMIKIVQAQQTDSITVEWRCNPYKIEDACTNPNCGGYFSHNLVGMRGGDYPAGFDRSIDA